MLNNADAADAPSSARHASVASGGAFTYAPLAMSTLSAAAMLQQPIIVVGSAEKASCFSTHACSASGPRVSAMASSTCDRRSSRASETRTERSGSVARDESPRASPVEEEKRRMFHPGLIHRMVGTQARFSKIRSSYRDSPKTMLSAPVETL